MRNKGDNKARCYTILTTGVGSAGRSARRSLPCSKWAGSGLTCWRCQGGEQEQLARGAPSDLLRAFLLTHWPFLTPFLTAGADTHATGSLLRLSRRSFLQLTRTDKMHSPMTSWSEFVCSQIACGCPRAVLESSSLSATDFPLCERRRTPASSAGRILGSCYCIHRS